MTHNDKARAIVASKNASLIDHISDVARRNFKVTEDENSPEYYDNLLVMGTYQTDERCECGNGASHPQLVGSGFIVGNPDMLKGGLIQQMTSNPKLAKLITETADEFRAGREQIGRLFKGLESLFGSIILDEDVPKEQREEMQELLNQIKERNSGPSPWERRLKDMQARQEQLRKKHNLEP